MSNEQDDQSSSPFEWEPELHAVHWQNMPEFKQPDNGPHRQVIISFESDEDVQEFAKLINRQISSKTKSLWFPDRPRGVFKELFWAEGEDE
jgi:hypothetical protein